MGTIKVGDIITFKYHDYDYSTKPLVVKEIRRRILIANTIDNGLVDENCEIKVARSSAEKLTVKTFRIKQFRMDSLIESIKYDGEINKSLFVEYTPCKNCLRKDKFDILVLYFKKQCVYIRYEEASFIRRKDGNLFVLLNGTRVCK